MLASQQRQKLAHKSNVFLVFNRVSALVALPIILSIWAAVIPVKETVATIGAFGWLSELDKFREQDQFHRILVVAVCLI